MNNEIILVSISKDELKEIIKSAIKTEIEQTNKKKLYTSKEICEVLNISMSTLNNWKSGLKLPYKKLGKRIYYDLEEIKKSMKESRFGKAFEFGGFNG